MIATLTNQPFKNTPIDSNSNKVHHSFQKQFNDCRINYRAIDFIFKLTKDGKRSSITEIGITGWQSSFLAPILEK